VLLKNKLSFTKKKAQIKFKELKKNEKELKKKDSFCTFAVTREAPLFKKLNSKKEKKLHVEKYLPFRKPNWPKFPFFYF